MAGLSLQDISHKANWRQLPRSLAAKWAWEARRAWNRLGWGLFIGTVCIALAGAALWQTRALAKQNFALQKKLNAVRSAVVVKPSVLDKQADIARHITDFYAYLPEHDLIPDQLKLLVSIAEKSGVTLTQAEYKAQGELNADFLRYQVILPIKADYPKIQAFVIAVLQELPTLVLNSVVFKRERIESEEVEARVHFVLLVKKPKSEVGQ